MKRPVQWTRSALEDIKDQIRFIAKNNPRAARRVALRIRETGAALGAMATGKPGRVTGTYEKTVPRLPYIIAYALLQQASGEGVVILRVIHTRRDWPEDDWPQ